MFSVPCLTRYLRCIRYESRATTLDGPTCLAMDATFNLQRKHRQLQPRFSQRTTQRYVLSLIPTFPSPTLVTRLHLRIPLRLLCTSLTRPLHRSSPRNRNRTSFVVDAYDEDNVSALNDVAKQRQNNVRTSYSCTFACRVRARLRRLCTSYPRRVSRFRSLSPGFVPASNIYPFSQRPRCQSLPLSCTSPGLPLFTRPR